MRLSRHALASLIAAVLLAAPLSVRAETIRVGLPTKTYWPTTVAETAVRQKLFEKEGISAELTIYRSGAETFEGMAAGAADIILDPPSLVSAGRKKGVMSRIVAKASMGNFGWQLMVPAKSTISRATANKYAHTPRGIYELKFFFNSGISRTNGEDLASQAVKSKIKELVDSEDVKRPHSDQKIVELLRDQTIDIARRTVAKYREQLGILSSSKRKQLF